MNKAQNINILIVDDHSFFRMGVISYFSKANKKNKAYQFFVDEAVNTAQAVEKAKAKNYDIILMDYKLPDRNGDACTLEILKDKPHSKILGMSGHDECDYLKRMMDAGANGYLSKGVSEENFLKITLGVIKGEEYFAPEIMKDVLKKQTLEKIITTTKPELTKRELEILRLLANGLSNKEISDKFFITVKTVDTHRYNLTLKFKAKTTVDLINKVKQLGFI